MGLCPPINPQSMIGDCACACGSTRGLANLACIRNFARSKQVYNTAEHRVKHTISQGMTRYDRAGQGRAGRVGQDSSRPQPFPGARDMRAMTGH